MHEMIYHRKSCQSFTNKLVDAEMNKKIWFLVDVSYELTNGRGLASPVYPFNMVESIVIILPQRTISESNLNFRKDLRGIHILMVTGQLEFLWLHKKL